MAAPGRFHGNVQGWLRGCSRGYTGTASAAGPKVIQMRRQGWSRTVPCVVQGRLQRMPEDSSRVQPSRGSKGGPVAALWVGQGGSVLGSGAALVEVQCTSGGCYMGGSRQESSCSPGKSPLVVQGWSSGCSRGDPGKARGGSRRGTGPAPGWSRGGCRDGPRGCSNGNTCAAQAVGPEGGTGTAPEVVQWRSRGESMRGTGWLQWRN